MHGITWNEPQHDPVIKDNEAHIYLIKIEEAKEHVPELKHFLTDEENKRAMKFVFEKDRITYVISRGALKKTLSRYLSINVEDVIFSYNKYGKPYLAENVNEKQIAFNLSHSGGLIMYAVSRSRNTGIDVQEMRDIDSWNNIVTRFFSEHEKSMFDSLSPELKKKAFYACWARKEAYIKALGRGLSYPLDRFSVSILPGEKAALLSDENNDVSRWSLTEIFFSDEYSAAVAVEGKNISYNYYGLTF